MQDPKLVSNIWKFGALLVTNKRVFVAILGVFYLTIPDTTVQTIGIIALTGSLAGFIFEIPSGYLADKLGHKQTLVFSRFLILGSTLFFLFAESSLWLILGSVFLSLGHAFFSGTSSAFMHETLRGLNRDKEYTKIMGKLSSIGFAIPIALIVTVPFLVEISYKVPFIIALVLDVVGLIIASSLIVPTISPKEIEEVKTTNFKQVIIQGYQLKFFRYLLFIAIIGGTLFTFGYFRGPYIELLGVPVIWLGVLLGLGRTLASLILFFSGRIRGFFPDILSFFRFQLFLYGALILVLASTTNVWVVTSTFIIISGFQWGLSQVSQGYLLEIIGKSKFKSTLLSIGSQISSIVSAVFGFALGMIVFTNSYQFAFGALLVALLVILIPLYLYIKKGATLS